MRAHNWVARRKVEGPKKIEDIHKDARMELQRQRMAAMPDRNDRRRGGPPMDRAPLPQCVLCHHCSLLDSSFTKVNYQIAPSQTTYRFLPQCVWLPTLAPSCHESTSSSSQAPDNLIFPVSKGDPDDL